MAFKISSEIKDWDISKLSTELVEAEPEYRSIIGIDWVRFKGTKSLVSTDEIVLHLDNLNVQSGQGVQQCIQSLENLFGRFKKMNKNDDSITCCFRNALYPLRFLFGGVTPDPELWPEMVISVNEKKNN